MPPKVPVYNGQIIVVPSDERLAPLTINTSGSKNYNVYLKYLPSGNTSDSSFEEWVLRHSRNISFYVSGGRSVEISVPLGTCEIYYAVGNTWYGANEKFGPDTEYYKCDDIFDFSEDEDGYLGWTLTLYPVQNGNMETDEISEDEFPI